MAEGATTPNHTKSLKKALHLFFWRGVADKLPASFAPFDRNGDGKLEQSEAEQCLMATFDEYVDADEIASLMAEADTEKNGTIEIGELISVLNKHRDAGTGGWGKVNVFE